MFIFFGLIYEHLATVQPFLVQPSFYTDYSGTYFIANERFQVYPHTTWH